ncbi:MAG: HAD family hydrolase [Planctomycetaceae bacterium]|nr:HAD family hydrolase [Planctomycetaceae bacterium]
MTYRAVVFDLDGTLVNSLEDLADAANFALTYFGQPNHSVETLKAMIGDGTRTFISRALPADKQDLIEQTLVKMRGKYIEICTNKTLPYKGIKEVLDELKKRGIKMAVLTNKDQIMSERVVKHFFYGYFQIIMGTIDAVPLKPDPKAVLKMLKELDVKPSEALFVGDSNIDIKTAKAAGIIGIGVNWGFRSEEELRQAGANFIINHPKELLNVLK